MGKTVGRVRVKVHIERVGVAGSAICEEAAERAMRSFHVLQEEAIELGILSVDFINLCEHLGPSRHKAPAPSEVEALVPR